MPAWAHGHTHCPGSPQSPRSLRRSRRRQKPKHCRQGIALMHTDVSLGAGSYARAIPSALCPPGGARFQAQRLIAAVMLLCSFLTQSSNEDLREFSREPTRMCRYKAFQPLAVYITQLWFCREIRCFCVNSSKCSDTRDREAPTRSTRSACRTSTHNRTPPRRLGTPKFSLKSSKTSARRSSSVQPKRLEQRNGTRSQRPKNWRLAA
jgi:hypothetical protein